LEKINLSLLKFLGSEVSYLKNPSANNTAMRSAADNEDVGCPDPAFEVITKE
jgi:hypothetical protein